MHTGFSVERAFEAPRCLCLAWPRISLWGRARPWGRGSDSSHVSRQCIIHFVTPRPRGTGGRGAQHRGCSQSQCPTNHGSLSAANSLCFQSRLLSQPAFSVLCARPRPTSLTALVDLRTRRRGPTSREAGGERERLLRGCQRGGRAPQRLPLPQTGMSQSPGAVITGPRRVSDRVSSSLRNLVK